MNRKNDHAKPPKWAERFLEFYCRPQLLEDLQGDLYQYFERNLEKKGATRAKIIYVIDVLKFLRPYTMRKPAFVNFLIQWIMIGSYVKTSGRSMVRNKLFTGINIIGLAISMTVGLLLIGVLVDIYSYDQFHVNRANLYRLTSRYEYLGKKGDSFMATTSDRAARAIQETITGHGGVAVFHRGFDGDMAFGEKALPFSGLWANNRVLELFTFPMISGNPRTALAQAYSVVLTESTAKKFFGDGDAVGKTLVLNKDKPYTVTGVLKDIPARSHIRFDMLGSLITRELQEKDNQRDQSWDNIWSTWAYVLIPPDQSLIDFQQKLDQLSLREDATVKNTHIELKLQPLGDIMIGEDLNNQIGPVLGSTLIWVFSALSFVVILSACFNYVNLSIARSLRRTREVGIRKVIGALRAHVISQFVVEAMILSLLALVVAIGGFVFLRTHFKGLEPSLQEILVLDLSPVLVICFVLFALLLGLVAGFFPALFFARINAIQVLKNVGSLGVFRKLPMRKVLIVAQYAISIMLITGTIIIYKQYKHYLAFDLGFSTDNILNIRLQGNKADIVKKELLEMPEVKEISQSGMITSVGNYWGTQAKNVAYPEDSAFVYSNHIDENYLPLHEHQLLAGTNFTPHADTVSEHEIILNEKALETLKFQYTHPAEVLGSLVRVEGRDLKIIGVLRDFHYGKATDDRNGKEVMFRYSNKDLDYINVKIQSQDLPASYARMESIWKKFDNTHVFDARFYDQQIEYAFRGIAASMKLAGFISFLAICIATMGLLGMVVFTSEVRRKEISIRKVMGANESTLIFTLGKGFIVLLLVGTLIALPVTYLFFDQVMLPMMSNHAPLNFFDGVMAVLGVLLVACIVISTQTIKVARANPAEVLKTE